MDIHSAPSPCYILDLGKLRKNLDLLDSIQKESGCKIILALKGFATFSAFPLIAKYLPGTSASSVNEALLGHQEFGGEAHIYSPAYTDSDIESLAAMAHTITFNSVGQFNRFKRRIFQINPNIEFGLRINPEYSEVKVTLYDPCAKNSRLGVTAASLEQTDLSGIAGFHFHTLCQQGAEVLARSLEVVEEKFGKWLGQLSWINFGGGHHITHPDYNTDLLIRTLRQFNHRWNLQVYLEPSEAIVFDAGVLVAQVLDIVHNGMDIAIMDTSAASHMPDVLEMPYRPHVKHSGRPGKKKYTYRLGGNTCLSGDVIGDYSFDQALKIGDRLVFQDMAQYTIVKNNFFNGVSLPSIALWDPDQQQLEVIKSFGFEDYRNRLS